MEQTAQEVKSSFGKLGVGKHFMIPGSPDVFIKMSGIESGENYYNALCIIGNNAGTGYESLLPNQPIVELTPEVKFNIFSRI